MMRTRSLALAALLFSAKTALAQPVPACPQPDTKPADNCAGACVYCGLSSFFGSTAGYTAGDAPGFCGSIENEQWLAFTAGISSAEFSVKPSGCQNGDGLQLAIYDGCGGTVVSCNVGCGSCGTAEKSVGSSSFIVGKTYFLVIDGYAGDICYFSLTVSPPGALLPPNLGLTSPIAGPDTVCKNGTAQFCVQSLPGASSYQWLIPPGAKIGGMPGPIVWLDAPDGNCADIQFSTTGGPVGCTPANSCGSGLQKSKAVFVDNTPPVPVGLPADTLCFSQVSNYKLPWGSPILNIADTTVLYQTLLVSTKNCDSLVQKPVTVLPDLLKFKLPDTLNSKMPTIVLAAPDTVSCKNFVWKNEAGDTVSVSKNLTVSEPGVYCLFAECAIGGFVCAEKSCVSITKKEVVAVGFFEKNGVKMQPNPAGDFVEIGFAQPLLEETVLSVFDGNGRLVFSKNIMPGQSKIEVETVHFPAGVYALNLKNRLGALNLKLAVTH